MTSKSKIDEQIETMEAVMSAEELRNSGLLQRGDLSKDEVDESTKRLKAVMATLLWVKDNRDGFLEFLKTQAKGKS